MIVRTKITPELSFAQALGRVRQSVLDAHARQELPFNILADHLEQEGIDPASLLQVYFTLQNPLRQPLDLPDVTMRSIGNVAREGQPVLPIDQTWLSLMLKERPTGITGSCNYKTELLDGGTVGHGWRISSRCSGRPSPNPTRRSAACSIARRHDRRWSRTECGFTRQSCE